MTIINEIGQGFQSLGNWMNSKVIQPFSNKVLSPVVRAITTPIKTITNISEGAEKMSEAWAKRSYNFTNDAIIAADNTITGFGNFMKAPLLPIALGLGAFYVFKK